MSDIFIGHVDMTALKLPLYRHENAIRRGKHSHYLTREVLDGFQTTSG